MAQRRATSSRLAGHGGGSQGPAWEKFGTELREVRVSRPFQTPEGETIRSLLTGPKTAVLTGVGLDLDDLTVVVCWPEEPDDDVVYLSFGDVWDAVKKIGGAIIDAISDGGGSTGGDGGGCKPSTPVNVTVSGGSIRDVNVTVNCTPQ